MHTVELTSVNLDVRLNHEVIWLKVKVQVRRRLDFMFEVKNIKKGSKTIT